MSVDDLLEVIMDSELIFHVGLDYIPTLTDVGTDMKLDTDMKLTWVWLAIRTFTDIATDMSQPRHWARHV
eukprot:6677045-Karenia_brevis.AAC.1